MRFYLFEARTTLLYNGLKNGVQVVGGSNPLTPTRKSTSDYGSILFKYPVGMD